MANGERPQSLVFGPDKYHPSYAARKEVVDYWMSIFRGDGQAKDYLQKFEGEDDHALKRRKDDTAFPRLCARVLGVFSAHIFAKSPNRSGLPEQIKLFVNDIDGNGTDADQFFAQCMGDKALPAGMSLILVTRPAVEVDTRQQEQLAGVKTFAEIFDARQLVSWDIDTDGSLKWIVLMDGRERATSFDQGFERVRQLRVWDRKGWAIYEQSVEQGQTVADTNAPWTLALQGVHKLGVVPLVPVYNIKEGPMQGDSEMGSLGLADLNFDIFAKSTWLDQGLKHQGFPITVIKSNRDKITTIDVGPGYGLQLDPEDDVVIAETTGKALGILKERIDGMRMELLDTAFRQTTPTKATGGAEAAEKKKLDMAQLVSVIRQKALSIQEAERQVWALFCRWEGITPPADEDSVKYDIQVAPEAYQATVDEICKLYNSSIIDRETAIELIIAGGEWPEELTAEDVEQRTADEQAEAAQRQQAMLDQAGTGNGDEGGEGGEE